MSRAPAPRLVWLGAAAILVIAAVVALAAIARGDFSDTDGRILGSLAAVLYTGGAVFAGLATVERGRTAVGWTVAVAAPICFFLLLPAIWTFLDESGDNNAWRWAWSAVLALLVGIMLATALLLARTDTAQLLALVTAAVAGVAAAASIAAIWTDGDGDGWLKAIGVLWILAVLAYALVPVVDRFTRTGQAPSERVLAVLGDVELVATTETTVTGPVGIDAKLATGERLLLRRQHTERQSTPGDPG